MCQMRVIWCGSRSNRLKPTFCRRTDQYRYSFIPLLARNRNDRSETPCRGDNASCQNRPVPFLPKPAQFDRSSFKDSNERPHLPEYGLKTIGNASPSTEPTSILDVLSFQMRAAKKREGVESTNTYCEQKHESS